MKKPFILIIAAVFLAGFLAYSSTNETKQEDAQIKRYDEKIQELKSEISQLNKSGSQRAAKLDSLLNTI